MASQIDEFERIARQSFRFTEAAISQKDAVHPFDLRNIHTDLPPETRRLFDNGHFSQSTFEAFKYIDEEIKRISGENDFGTSLMMRVFGGISPAVRVTPLVTETEKKEQEGFKYLFAGGMLAIRNPRAHKSGMTDDPDICLDHLTLASMLLRKLDDAGLR